MSAKCGVLLPFCNLVTYLLTPRCRVLLEQLTGTQLVKKFPAFHGIRMFITAITSVRHLSLSWASPLHITKYHFLEIHPNLIHPSKPRSPQWSLSLRFPHQDPIHSFSSPICATCPAHLILVDFTPARFWVRSTNYLDPRYAVFSSPPLPRPS